MFLLPLFAATSAAGLWLVLTAVNKSFQRRYSLISVGAATVLLCITFIPDIRASRLPMPTFGGAEQGAVWMKTHLNAPDVLLVENSLKPPMLYYLHRHGTNLINRPARCDSQAVTVFATKARFAGETPTEGARLLVLAHGTQDWPGIYRACLPGYESMTPQLAYSAGSVRFLESLQTGPEEWPILGFHQD
jgi:hypothetical protein